MVGQRTLTPLILVRVQIFQPVLSRGGRTIKSEGDMSDVKKLVEWIHGLFIRFNGGFEHLSACEDVHGGDAAAFLVKIGGRYYAVSVARMAENYVPEFN